MAIRRRKPSLGGTLRDILLAPFALIFVQLYVFRWILAFGGVCALICWLLGADFALKDFDRGFLLIGGMLIVLIAAIPLAIKDYVTGTGHGVYWEPDEACAHAAQSYGECVLRRDFEAFQQRFLPQTTVSSATDTMRARFLSITAGVDPPVAIVRIEELPIDARDERCLDDFDSIVRVTFRSLSHVSHSYLDLYLIAADECQIVDWSFIVNSDTGMRGSSTTV